VIRVGSDRKLTRGVGLRLSKSVLDFFEHINIKCASLANNHYFDFNKQYNLLMDHGINVVGAGNNIHEASRPFYFEEDDILTVSYGWDVIGCRYAGNNSLGINPCKKQKSLFAQLGC
jgi:poly-gamma-glutamate synthesis protein (capsule biosynthesis protein)